ncbi:MAG TPA: hypothetical protein DD435_13970 [Cyanobacteria bacterium UBA8530]|nr:hypothetical protein [Cyanobacteria bacterium UBA8530]
MFRSSSLTFLAGTCLISTPALAVTAMDARSLGMGNAATAVANDANSPSWNPAGLSQGNGFFYLPTQFGIRLGNNAVGISEVSALNTTLTSIQDYQKDPTKNPLPKVPDFIKDGDFRLGGNVDLGLFGVSFPIPTPFKDQGKANVGLSVWGKVNGETRFQAGDFLDAVGNAYDSFNGTDKKIAVRLATIQSEFGKNDVNIGTIKDEVNGVITDLDSGMGDLLNSKDKKAEVSLDAGAYITTVLTASHQIKPPKLPFFPNARFSVGTNLKVFSALDPFSMGGSAPTLPFGDKTETVGLPETIRIQAKGNFGTAYANLRNQVQSFAANPTPEKFSDFSSASQQLVKDIPVEMDVTTTKASSTGFGCDLGAMAQLDDRLTVGATLVNPLVFWPATQTVRHTTWDGATSKFTDSPSKAESVTYRDTEPLAIRMGASYKALLGIRLAADLEQEFSDIPPALRLGGEWGLGPVALRAGTQIGGENNSLNLGLGLNMWALKMNLGAGVDPGFKAAAAALSGSLSF